MVAGRLVTLIADLVLIVLVGRLAEGRQRAQASFAYACCPLALMVSVLHGQIQSVALMFLIGAYLAARARHPLTAGLLFGLALSAGSWPIILLPVMPSMHSTWPQRLRALAATTAVPLLFLVTLPLTLHTGWKNLSEVGSRLGGVRPIVGEWGWTAVLTHGQPQLVPAYAQAGQLILYTTLAVVAWRWRRADKVDITSAMLLAFLIVTPRMGAQYLLWFTPFLIARPTRWSRTALTATTIWAATGYLYLTQYDEAGWWTRHIWWSQASLLVIPLLILAMPWSRRDTPIASKHTSRRASFAADPPRTPTRTSSMNPRPESRPAERSDA